MEMSCQHLPDTPSGVEGELLLFLFLLLLLFFVSVWRQDGGLSFMSFHLVLLGTWWFTHTTFINVYAKTCRYTCVSLYTSWIKRNILLLWRYPPTPRLSVPLVVHLLLYIKYTGWWMNRRRQIRHSSYFTGMFSRLFFFYKLKSLADCSA